MRKINLKEIEKDYEENWKRIVNILSEILDTDAALINSVEGDKLEVLKKNASPENPFKVKEPYDLGDVYCEGVVRNREMMEINNASASEKWNDYAGARMGLISYLGYPLFGPEGKVVGTICVEDSEERQFTENDKNLLEQFKEMVENQLKQMELTRRLEENIERGRQLHAQFLPAELPDVEGVNFGTYYRAADRLGGDFYDVKRVGEKILFYVSDVSGHDLSSSLLNIFLKEAINSYLLYQKQENAYLSPSHILKHINRRFKEENFPADYFITLVVGVMDLNEYSITLSNGGVHVRPFIVHENGELTPFSCGGFPVWAIGREGGYAECTHDIKSGEIFHIHTDGLIEQENSFEERFEEERLRALARETAGESTERIVNRIYQEFDSFRGDTNIQDDLTSFLIGRV